MSTATVHAPLKRLNSPLSFDVLIVKVDLSFTKNFFVILSKYKGAFLDALCCKNQ